MKSKKSNTKKKVIIAIIIFIAMFLIMTLICAAEQVWVFAPDEEPVETEESTESSLEMDDQGAWDGQQYEFDDNTAANDETITIPGFSDMIISESSPKIKLFNYSENTVNFVYCIKELVDTQVVGSYTSAEDADAALLAEQSDGTKEYQVKIENNRYNVIENTYSDIYTTKGIAPGNYVDWDVKASLKEGEHKVRFCIFTYDITTNKPCYGANVEAVITVK